MIRILILVVIALAISSCQKDEKFINNFDDKDLALLAINNESQSALRLVNLSNGNIEIERISLNNNDSLFNTPIDKIKSFREHIFVFQESAFRIIALYSNDYSLAGVVDFSAQQLVPSDICFANATDAYIAHGNSNLVSLLDLKNLQIARSIVVGNKPISIAASGNQIYTTNFQDNTVSVIDSRTNREEAVIGVPLRPMLIDVKADGKEFVVVSAGEGKLTEGEKTNAMVTFIDVATRNIINEIPLGVGAVQAIDVVPLGLAVSSRDWAFISSADNFFRINLRTKSGAINIGRYKYSGLYYNFYKSVVVAIEKDNSGNSIRSVICNNTTGRKLSDFAIPNGTKWIHPIY